MRSRWWAGAAVLAVAAVVAGLVWFKPWALWVDDTVHEALPSTTGTASSRAPGAAPSAAATTLPTGPTTVAQGTFTSHEHTTTGTVKLIRLPDGSHTVRLENLDTSNGPDLRVWLTDAPVKEGRAGWHVFDDGTHVSLGKLKGNKGDQNYAVPADVDLTDLASVAIWCDRFNVSFGAAELA
ncbi:DM13 domain-containing protein [Streptomyces sp. NPDC000410]|uniref:DM13 domain-containing protein n=1 Tax=Streptomyces sp. NPDC000410 TaxID=3154254 RepID=UPI0033250DC7